MQVKLAGNNREGFSILEIVIALALLLIFIVGAVEAIASTQYWRLTSVTAREALEINQILIEKIRAESLVDFESASTTDQQESRDVNHPADSICLTGGLCYYKQIQVTDISTCAKSLQANVSWRLGTRYPTSTVTTATYLKNSSEIIARGGDCLVTLPTGNWLTSPPQLVGEITTEPQQRTSFDVFQNYIYITSASTTNPFEIYRKPTIVGESPILVGSSAGANLHLNAIDVVRDMGTGRIYAYVMQHASTSQLGVFDVTDATNPVLITERTLGGANSTGSFPQGWRVMAYGERLYAMTRETAGQELHIFSITNPRNPIEIFSARYNLNRTVNDLTIHEQMINGSLRRYLFLASSANLKELGVFEVTNDIPIERGEINLPTEIDAISLHLQGDNLFLGRKNNTSGPELYLFSLAKLLSDHATTPTVSEVGADVQTIKGAGDFIFIGTNQVGKQFQVWHADTETWNATTAGAGKVTDIAVPRLAPLGIEISENYVYLLTESNTQPETLSIIYTP